MAHSSRLQFERLILLIFNLCQAMSNAMSRTPTTPKWGLYIFIFFLGMICGLTITWTQVRHLTRQIKRANGRKSLTLDDVDCSAHLRGGHRRIQEVPDAEDFPSPAPFGSSPPAILSLGYFPPLSSAEGSEENTSDNIEPERIEASDIVSSLPAFIVGFASSIILCAVFLFFLEARARCRKERQDEEHPLQLVSLDSKQLHSIASSKGLVSHSKGSSGRGITHGQEPSIREQYPWKDQNHITLNPMFPSHTSGYPDRLYMDDMSQVSAMTESVAIQSMTRKYKKNRTTLLDESHRVSSNTKLQTLVNLAEIPAASVSSTASIPSETGTVDRKSTSIALFDACLDPLDRSVMMDDKRKEKSSEDRDVSLEDESGWTSSAGKSDSSSEVSVGTYLKSICSAKSHASAGSHATDKSNTILLGEQCLDDSSEQTKVEEVEEHGDDSPTGSEQTKVEEVEEHGDDSPTGSELHAAEERQDTEEKDLDVSDDDNGTSNLLEKYIRVPSTDPALRCETTRDLHSETSPKDAPYEKGNFEAPHEAPCFPTQSSMVDDCDSLVVSLDCLAERIGGTDEPVQLPLGPLPWGIVQYCHFLQSANALEYDEYGFDQSDASTSAHTDGEEVDQLDCTIGKSDGPPLQDHIAKISVETVDLGASSVVSHSKSMDDVASVSVVESCQSYVRSVYWVPMVEAESSLDLGIEMGEASCPASNPIVKGVKDDSPLKNVVGDIILAVNDIDTVALNDVDMKKLLSSPPSSEKKIGVDVNSNRAPNAIKLTIMSAESDESETGSTSSRDTSGSLEIASGSGAVSESERSN